MSRFDPTPWLHFAVTTIDFENTPTGTKIIVASDKVCHLWKKWKRKPPSRRKFWTIQRGIKTYCYPKYYLHKPYTMEQQEPGDTITHTFIQDPWPDCETHWFFFIGSVGGTPSSSQSGIFQYHRTAPKIFIAPAHPYDLEAASPYGHTYLSAWWANGIYYSDTVNRLAILSHQSWRGMWQLLRCLYVFDTTLLDPSWELTFATITFNCGAKHQDDPSYLCFVNANSVPVPGSPDSYQQLRDCNDILAQTLISTILVGVYTTLIIHPGKLSAIKPGQLTKIGIRRSLEINADPGTQGTDKYWGAHVSSYEYPVLPPYLTIHGK